MGPVDQIPNPTPKVVHHVARRTSTYQTNYLSPPRKNTLCQAEISLNVLQRCDSGRFVDYLSDLLAFPQLQSDFQWSARRRLPDAGFGYDESDEGLLHCIIAQPRSAPRLLSACHLHFTS